MKKRIRKLRQFSRNEFCKNIICINSEPNFGVGGSRLEYKEDYTHIRSNKMKRRIIRGEVDF